MNSWLKSLNVEFNDLNLYEVALTHASYGNENSSPHNERLEFLGDAVLEVLISEYLYTNAEASEGEMTKRRAQAVREEALVIYGNSINIGNYLKVGKSEELKGPNDAMIADAFEALLGAIFIDLGIDAVRGLFNDVVIKNLDRVFVLKDFKSFLQEIIQSGDKRNLSYHIIKESGPSHNKRFEAVVKLDGNILLGVGRGKTKKEAEQMAAKDALRKGTYDIKKNL